MSRLSPSTFDTVTSRFSFHYTFVSPLCPRTLREILQGYRPVMWLNLLAVVRVSSLLRTRCCVCRWKPEGLENMTVNATAAEFTVNC